MVIVACEGMVLINYTRLRLAALVLLWMDYKYRRRQFGYSHKLAGNLSLWVWLRGESIRVVLTTTIMIYYFWYGDGVMLMGAVWLAQGMPVEPSDYLRGRCHEPSFVFFNCFLFGGLVQSSVLFGVKL